MGVYRLAVTDDLVKEQTDLIFPGKLGGRPRERAEQRSREQLASVVLIEVIVRHCDESYSVGDFTQPLKGKSRSSWQVAWAETYLTEDGTARLQARWPDPPAKKDFRVAFFMHFWNPALPLRSSYGELKCPAVKEMPERLTGLVRYEPVDRNRAEPDVALQTMHFDRGRILVSRDTTPLQRPRRVNFFVGAVGGVWIVPHER